MKASIWIDKLNFKIGKSISLNKNSIVVFVGPNNSGKTHTLKEIFALTNGRNQFKSILDSVEIISEGSFDDFAVQIDERRKGDTFYYHISSDTSPNSGMGSSSLKQYWENLSNNKNNGAPAVANFFTKFIDTVTRLNLVTPAENIDSLTELKKHPIHDLKQDLQKELLFSTYFKKAFGEDVIVNHAFGTKVPLHVGTRPIITAENDRVSSIYQSQLRKLPFLHEQGDGMKSFGGVFLSLFVESFTINLIDEPEAFLHPPQATLLGQMMGQSLGDEKQIFVATHSEHFLKGLLDNAAERLIIIRIQKEDATTKINILDNEVITKVWGDTLLRHSNVLDGLFHKKVVLAESDSDCRFYNAFVTALVEKENFSSQDILFVPSNGKDRFPVVIKALKALEVPLIVIGDFDLYHNENPIRKIYEELDGQWDDIKVDFNKIKKAVDEKMPELKTDDLKIEIEKILSTVESTIFPEDKIKAIQSVLKKSSPWRQAKASGKAYLPSGEVTLVFNRLQQKLLDKGIVILEMGEIEAFNKSIGGHGPKWVNEVLKKDLINSLELGEVRTFIRSKILNSR